MKTATSITTNIATLREAFFRDGFVVIEGFFSDDEMDRVDAELARYVRDILPTLPPGVVLREQATSGPIKSMSKMDEFDPFFASFKANPRFSEMVAELFQVGAGEVVSESFQFFGKAAHGGSVTPWHQDNGFQQLHPPESLMIWMAVDDVDEENGCVVFAKSSHRLGTVQHRPSGVLAFSQTPVEPVDLERFPPVPSVMKRGGISLHHCNTFHSSGANRSPRSRRAMAINFRTTRCRVNEEKRERVRAEAERLYREKTEQ